MPGISPKLPLAVGKPEISYTLNKDLKQAISQNLKNLILTNPGEKVFDDKFGAGIRRFLFENADYSTSERIQQAIIDQISEYMPFLRIESLQVNNETDYNKIYISLAYSIPTLTLADTLSLEIARV
jgi:phage baseplate assembly protein W